ncbi:TIM-barrel domain-containing protein [Limibacter armeniacum]|uniref:glycoside hydrolase family 31 protein n=1 Tax=Limibacter armeniacum TaxID=466084 RepID=UPI002FE5089D
MYKKILFGLMFCLFLIVLNTFGQAVNNPTANPEAVITDGNVRFTVLTARLIRMEYSENTHFEDKASLAFINRNLPVPPFKTKKSGKWLEVKTDSLTLRYLRDSGPFEKKNLQITFLLNDKKQVWYPDMVDTANLKGTTRTVDGFEGTTRYWDGKKLELEQGLISKDGWSLVDDSDRLLFDGNQDWDWVTERNTGNNQDWYFFGYGHAYKDALADFTKVAGKIPLPPRYAFGYWWSRYWIYADREMKELVSTLRSYDIPVDVMIMDMDWHETYGLTSNNPEKTPFNGMLGWTGYTWNKNLFPQPDKFLNWTASEKLKTALNLHPADGIAPMEDNYQPMVEALDGDTTKEGWIEYQLSDKRWAKAYFEYMLRPKEKLGNDFWWIDWQQWQESKHMKGLSNTFWLNYVFFTDMEKQYPEKRPLLFHRWGGLGNHRYQVGFSGDAVISWESLAFQPYFTATASNVGYGYWSHDIGGHIDKDKELAKDGELYLRWIQFGTLSPIFRTHASKSDVAERRFWKYPEYFPMMRDAVQFRYALVPYLYTAARLAYDTGISICRPMYYDYPDSEKAYSSDQQYMLGDKLLVAPIVSAADKQTRLATQTVWLPEGQWYEWSTGALLEGGQEIRRRFSFEEIPLYVKVGSIIPMYPKVSNLQDQPNEIVFSLVPGGTDDIRFYEDNGDGQGYKKSAFAWTRVKSEKTASGIRLTIFPTEGVYQDKPEKRAYTLNLLNSLPVEKVLVNGQSLSDDAFPYNAMRLTQVIHTGNFSLDEKVIIEVEYQTGMLEQQEWVNGKAGLFRRLEQLGEQLRLASAKNDWGATIPNPILNLISTPTYMEYNPEKAISLLKEMDNGLPQLQQWLTTMPQISEEKAIELVNYLQFDAVITEKEEQTLQKDIR